MGRKASKKARKLFLAFIFLVFVVFLWQFIYIIFFDKTEKMPPEEDVSLSSLALEYAAYAIGLPTLDEVIYAGGALNTNNTGYFMKGDTAYWTMTPLGIDKTPMMATVSSSGSSGIDLTIL